jgi:valyl-tRNA synthetase
MGDVEGGITLADGTKSSGLAQAAIDAVTSGRVKIIPERYAQGYIDWLSQKRDWCISRQLWWGHRIPVWTMKLETSNKQKDTKCFNESSEMLAHHGILAESIISQSNTAMLVLAARNNHAEQILQRALRYINELTFGVAQYPGKEPADVADIILQVWNPTPGTEVQDPDVLDTWFSSALWPLSTMGWPRKGTSDNPEDHLLPYFYPTSVLSTAREILTLWVARMVMFGLYCHGDVPFKQVYIHAVIQDGNGKPMKKSLGNGVDPVDIVESHGADALRFTLASMATETQDIRLPVVKDKQSGKNTSPRFDAGRNFANKIWNAARFILSNIELTTVPTLDEIIQISDGKFLEDRWILSRLNDTVARVAGTGEQKGLIEEFKFADVCSTLYSFFWNDLCDWYLEIAKARIRRKDPGVQRILLYVLRGSLALLHPVMPFVTEAVWEKIPGAKNLLMLSEFPRVDPRLNYPEAESKIYTVQQITRAIRDIRNQYNVDLKRTLETTIQAASSDAAIILSGAEIIESMANAKLIAVGPDALKPANAATAVVGANRIFVAGVINRDSEMARLEKRRQELEKLIASSNAKLTNQAFVEKAPPSVVQGLRDQLQRQESELATVQTSLNELAVA